MFQVQLCRRKILAKQKGLMKRFSTKYQAHNKNKKLNDFFRIPKHEINDETMADDVSARNTSKLGVLNEYKNEENIDELDLIRRNLKKSENKAKTQAEKFFSNTTDRETIKISENIIEKLRLKKQIDFNESYKQKYYYNEIILI